MTTTTEPRSTCTTCQHPADGHDADAVACPDCSGSGECAHCADADSYACNTCLCTGECVHCDGTGGIREASR